MGRVVPACLSRDFLMDGDDKHIEPLTDAKYGTLSTQLNSLVISDPERPLEHQNGPADTVNGKANVRPSSSRLYWAQFSRLNVTAQHFTTVASAETAQHAA